MFRVLDRLFSGKNKGRSSRAVLVIDPSVPDAVFVRKALRSRLFRVFTAREGGAGLQIAAQENPDLVVLECVLPDMEGLEVCRIVRSNPRMKDIPVLFITAVQDGYLLLQCFGAGGDGFLNKPVSAAELISEVEFILRKDNRCLRG